MTHKINNNIVTKETMGLNSKDPQSKIIKARQNYDYFSVIKNSILTYPQKVNKENIRQKLK